jgi:riboflavin synthase
MFTGIIQEIGRVKSIAERGGNSALTVDSTRLTGKLDIGSSIAINGACLTITELSERQFTVEAIEETLLRTNLGRLKPGSWVNLEAPLKPDDLLHGHLVQGHADCTGTISRISQTGGSTIIAIEYPEKYGKFLIEKGSIAVDGISLTIAELSRGRFSVALIPHTMENTNFKYKRSGEAVNLEFDVIAKYVERMATPENRDITVNFLREHGFG